MVDLRLYFDLDIVLEVICFDIFYVKFFEDGISFVVYKNNIEIMENVFSFDYNDDSIVRIFFFIV